MLLMFMRMMVMLQALRVTDFGAVLRVCVMLLMFMRMTVMLQVLRAQLGALAWRLLVMDFSVMLHSWAVWHRPGKDHWAERCRCWRLRQHLARRARKDPWSERAHPTCKQSWAVRRVAARCERSLPLPVLAAPLIAFCLSFLLDTMVLLFVLVCVMILASRHHTERRK